MAKRRHVFRALGPETDEEQIKLAKDTIRFHM